MLFQTQGFILVFLPLALAVYWSVAGHERLRQWVLIAASLVFYGWWDVRFLPLLLGQIGLTWLLAGFSDQGRRLWPVAIGVVINLASLATFKYLDFLISSAAILLGHELPRAGLTLPIGISFFSFQLISYLVDLRRQDAPIYPLRPFALFVLLFPHLIAGPIVRHNELVPQFALDPRRAGMAQRFATGGMLFVLGLAKKVWIADKLAGIADPLFLKATTASLKFAESWTASIAFSLQLFLDFSAYTEMAIGIALMFGLLLPENFRRPYLATDMRDFWRRWHMSLSLFLRDYLYIPLGGSRGGMATFLFASLATMAICGLWHGAGWTFVAWGLWHGVGLIVCRGWQGLKRPLPTPLAWTLTMAFVLVGWVLFRAADFTTAWNMLGSMAGIHGFSGKFGGTGIIALGAAVSVLIPSAHEIKDRWLVPSPALASAAALLAIACVLQVGSGAPVNFIYFQF